jgi:anti-anti-sigma factor
MIRILLIGEEDRVSLRLGRILRSASYTVLHVPNLTAAEDYLKTEQLSGIFCFNAFAGGTVQELLLRLKQKGLAIPVVVLAPFSNSEAAGDAMALGAVDFLPYPFDPTEVTACAARLLYSEQQVLSSQQIRFQAKQGVLVLHFPPEVVFEAARHLACLVEDGLPAPERGIVFNLSQTNYFSSSGIGVLFLIHKSFPQLTGKICICGARAQIRNTIRLAGAAEFFRLLDTEAEAIEAL